MAPRTTRDRGRRGVVGCLRGARRVLVRGALGAVLQLVAALSITSRRRSALAPASLRGGGAGYRGIKRITRQ
eukprot:CAMPEP_0182926438 /NCGR_PEP_ID=MMETSP0105_2-20130417/12083_1 /TAXON_ID=81532 ORGANISM="Acanthoeca-like sp., Strain 10tr" /NCGR_SAMPLE_ID=MMETSP0105_2 /ASSEMBLY_ACC=CAM_ASM_000205 /LENGTH=71 /DNA_ID=CAMNT_0025064335 /DNA_START=48 /DNA_END=260 /DNA_ORIENTATION=+